MGFMDGLRSSNSNLFGLANNNTNNSYDGGPDNFTNQVLAIHKGEQDRRNRIEDAMLMHQLTPINRYADPLTTKPMDVRNGQPALSPLDMAKLKQGEEKLSDARNKEKGELGFKQDKESTDSAIRQQRANIYDYKSKHPDHKFDFSGATVKVANPADGSVYDTGVPTDKLSMEDRMNLSASQGVMRDTNRLNIQGSNNINRDNNNANNNINRDNNRSTNDVMRDSNRINMTEGSNIRRDNNRSTNNITEIGARGDQTRETNAAKPSKANSISNSQAHQGYLNKAEELVNSNPAYAPYIKLGKSDNGKVNGFTVNPINGADDPTYHEINSKIYGSVGDVAVPSNDKSKSDKSKNSSKSNEDKSEIKPDPLGIR